LVSFIEELFPPHPALRAALSLMERAPSALPFFIREKVPRKGRMRVAQDWG